MSMQEYSQREVEIQNRVILPMMLGQEPFVPSQKDRLHVGLDQYAVFQSLLAGMRPQVAIEIGAFEGQTLDLIARHSNRTVSIDPNPAVKERLEGRIPNCEFLVKTSDDALPSLIAEFNEQKTPLEFVFVDGNHARDFVFRDLTNLLRYRPVTRTVILMHDSFNPKCRSGMLAVDWQGCPHCHYVELDFCSGLVHINEDCRGEMWGGLGFVLLLPEARTEQLIVRQTHQLTFEAARSARQASPRSWLGKLLGRE